MVFPLRLLRLKSTNAKLYKQITSLEGHVQHRKDQVSSLKIEKHLSIPAYLHVLFNYMLVRVLDGCKVAHYPPTPTTY